jgi:hypothetical protein
MKVKTQEAAVLQETVILKGIHLNGLNTSCFDLDNT